MTAPESSPAAAEAVQFVQYLFLRTDSAWRRLDASARRQGRREFAEVLDAAKDVTTHAYSTLGLKAGTDLLLWWKAERADAVQDVLGDLLRTGLGQYCDIAHSLWGLTRPVRSRSPSTSCTASARSDFHHRRRSVPALSPSVL